MTGILASCAAGHVDAARAEARHFRARWPRSPLAARVDGSCAGAAGRAQRALIPLGPRMRARLRAFGALGVAGMVRAGPAATRAHEAAGLRLLRGARAAPPPAGTDPFYGKYLTSTGSRCCRRRRSTTPRSRPRARSSRTWCDARRRARAMIAQQLSVAVIGDTEVTTDVPEYRNLNQMFPRQNWDRLRGVGATDPIPVARRAKKTGLSRGRLVRRRKHPGADVRHVGAARRPGHRFHLRRPPGHRLPRGGRRRQVA